MRPLGQDTARSDLEDAPDAVESVLAELTLDERAALTAGVGMFDLARIDRLGVGGWRMTDGPNGARGANMLGSGRATALCVPCGSALGATWDPGLVDRVATAVGGEARAKGYRVLLAPTVNLVRSPLAGRTFESLSEDPVLSGVLAAAYVTGAQSAGVIATVKHLVANEAETDRRISNSVIDERTLRELYLVPFEHAVRDGGALGVMAAYNRLNGTYCTERADLLTGILRDEWGFRGFVTTDWHGVATTVASSAAGVDIEMPGPARAFGRQLADAVRRGEVSAATVERQARHLLAAFEAVGALDDDTTVDDVEVTGSAADTALAHEAAIESIVLLRNSDVEGRPQLPLDSGALGSIAVIGPNAADTQLMGGGSAALRARHSVSLLAALRRRVVSEVEVRHEPGCPTTDGASMLSADRIDEQGFHVEVLDGADGAIVDRWHQHLSRFSFGHTAIESALGSRLGARMSTSFTARFSGEHRFELVQAGRARLRIDGQVVIDGHETFPEAGHALLGHGSHPIVATVELRAGRPVDLEVEYAAGEAGTIKACSVGVAEPWPSSSISDAVEAASACDVAVVVVGTDEDTEGEGFDRDRLQLPGRQDELVAAVVAANPRTIVIVNAASPVAMPWLDVDRPPSVLQVWFGGQETGTATVDVLLGRAEPGGRLPVTIPATIEQTPAFGTFPGEHAEVRYGEGLLVGYRWFDTRNIEPRFPFGHGGSYTRFVTRLVDAPASFSTDQERIDVDIEVRNVGERRGAHVLQCYVCPPPHGPFRPAKELRAFEKLRLDPGEHTTVSFELDARAFAHWDPAASTWIVEPGIHRLAIGRSVADIDHVVDVHVAGRGSVDG